MLNADFAVRICPIPMEADEGEGMFLNNEIFGT